MKLAQDTREFDSNLQNANAQFTIQASAKAFQILSANLYSDRALAIVRELLCNAWDAHVLAGTTDKPIDVRLPSTFNNYFVVRDYGTGLSHEDMLTLYTTYFGSNKTHTNDLIGGLGLGSKSPLSYTDQFTVTSYFNGHYRLYQVYIDSNGTPNIMALTDATPTQEPNGLKVEVPVKEDDWSRFRDRLETFGSWMPVVPNCAQATWEVVPKSTRIELMDNCWAVVHKDRVRPYHAPHSSAYIKQGIVHYPLPGIKSATKMSWQLLGKCIFEVPVGTFEVAPSREALSPTPAQLQWAETFFADAKERIEAQILKDVPTKASFFEYRAAVEHAVELGANIDGLFNLRQWTSPSGRYFNFEQSGYTKEIEGITIQVYYSTTRLQARVGRSDVRSIGSSRDGGYIGAWVEKESTPKMAGLRALSEQHEKNIVLFTGDRAKCEELCTELMGHSDLHSAATPRRKGVRNSVANSARRFSATRYSHSEQRGVSAQNMSAEEISKLAAAPHTYVLLGDKSDTTNRLYPLVALLSNTRNRALQVYIVAVPESYKKIRKELLKQKRVIPLDHSDMWLARMPQREVFRSKLYWELRCNDFVEIMEEIPLIFKEASPKTNDKWVHAAYDLNRKLYGHARTAPYFLGKRDQGPCKSADKAVETAKHFRQRAAEIKDELEKRYPLLFTNQRDLSEWYITEQTKRTDNE